MPETVVGLFPTRSEAESALRKHERAGVTSDDIDVVTPRRRGAIVGAVLTALDLRVGDLATWWSS
jgi:hypothetical protein